MAMDLWSAPNTPMQFKSMLSSLKFDTYKLSVVFSLFRVYRLNWNTCNITKLVALFFSQTYKVTYVNARIEIINTSDSHSS